MGSSSAEGPVLLAVANRDLDRLAMDFAISRPGARSYFCAQADAVDFVRRRAVDLILLDVDASLMAAFVLAAHIRAADRGRGACRSVAIAAFTSSECKFQDCLVGGSAIDGALKMPCDFRLFVDCLDRWCLADDFRSRRMSIASHRTA
jgi:CheY-like chemotaxis protein